MILYLADRDPDQLSKSGAKKILFSYYYHSDVNFIKIKRRFFKKGVRVFVDSGGFTAMTKGAEIDVKDYCEYLLRNKDHFDCYANLDVIGNQVLTRSNQEAMESMGLSPLPVFHVGSGFKELESLCDKYEYIAIGGMVPYATYSDSLMPFLDRVFEIAGETKLHGFGCTIFNTLIGYPWYSVDSTTWMAGLRYGQVSLFDRSALKIRRIRFRDWEEWRKNRRLIEGLGFDWREVASQRTLNKTTLLNLGRASFEDLENYLTEKWGR